MKKKNLVLGFILFLAISISLSAQNMALQFDGTNDYVDCGNNASFNPGEGSFTIEAWIKPDGLTGSKRFIWKNDGTFPPFNGYYISTSGSVLSAELSDDTNYINVYGGTLTVGSWYHIALVRDISADEVRLYMNGVEIDKETDNTSNIICYGNMGVGGRTDMTEEMFDGQIDEVRIWNDVRTLVEIQGNMYKELDNPTSETHLVAYYKFNESSGTNLPDESSNSNNGTLYNGESIGNGPTWVLSDALLPVELSTFTAQFINDIPTLCWTTQSETSNAGWNIYRGETNEALSNEETYQLNLSLGLIPGAGTTSEPTDYSFEDVFPVYQGTTYFYWLESVDYSGETENFGPISLTIPENEWENLNSPEIPKNYGLHQNYPNPFNPNTEISFIMKENCIAELSIYNIKGEKIATLFQNKSVAKDELIRINWDGKDNFGKTVSSGIYLYKLRTNKEDFVRKMILLK